MTTWKTALEAALASADAEDRDFVVGHNHYFGWRSCDAESSDAFCLVDKISTKDILDESDRYKAWLSRREAGDNA